MKETIARRFDESIAVTRQAARLVAGAVAEAAETIAGAVGAGGGVYLFGNGGSAADAQHIAGELVNRFLIERRAIRAVALTTDSSILTSVANDSDYERVFARQIEALGRPGDVAVALTTSGNSPSVLAGLAAAREIGMKTVALTGRGGGRCAELADVIIDVPSDQTPRVQETHVVIYHILCELVESAVAK